MSTRCRCCTAYPYSVGYGHVIRHLQLVGVSSVGGVVVRVMLFVTKCMCVSVYINCFFYKVYSFTVIQINKVKNGIKLPGLLAEYDKGNYTCIVQNHRANMSRTFVLDIISMIFAYFCVGVLFFM